MGTTTEELVIRTEAELAGVTSAKDAVSLLKTEVKALDYQFRMGAITQKELEASLVHINETAHTYNITRKQEVDLAAQIFQVQRHASVGFQSLAVSIDGATKSIEQMHASLRQKTNPALISLSQIIQDAPYGIRGVGNNIEFLSQQFTQLSSQGMKTRDILSGMIAGLSGPTGILIVISLVTALATVFGDKLFANVKKSNEAIEEGIKLLHDLGRISDDQYIKSLEREQSKLSKQYSESGRSGFFGQLGQTASTYASYAFGGSMAQLVTDRSLVGTTAADLELRNKILSIEKEISSERDKQAKEIEKNAPSIINNLNKEISALTEKRKLSQSMAEIGSLNLQIFKKQEELDNLTKKPKDETLKIEKNLWDIAKLKLEAGQSTLSQYMSFLSAQIQIETVEKRRLELQVEYNKQLSKYHVDRMGSLVGDAVGIRFNADGTTEAQYGYGLGLAKGLDGSQSQWIGEQSKKYLRGKVEKLPTASQIAVDNAEDANVVALRNSARKGFDYWESAGTIAVRNVSNLIDTGIGGVLESVLGKASNEWGVFFQGILGDIASLSIKTGIGELLSLIPGSSFIRSVAKGLGANLSVSSIPRDTAATIANVSISQNRADNSALAREIHQLNMSMSNGAFRVSGRDLVYVASKAKNQMASYTQ